MQLKQKQNYTIKNKKLSPPVFISYSSKDQNIANELSEALQKHGIESWISSKSIKEGSYAKQIIQGINGAKIFLVLISKNSIASNHVKNEIDRAHSRLKEGIIIIPFIIDECELDEECEYYLCRQEMINGTNPPILDRINEIAIRITNLLD